MKAVYIPSAPAQEKKKIGRVSLLYIRVRCIQMTPNVSILDISLRLSGSQVCTLPAFQMQFE